MFEPELEARLLRKRESVRPYFAPYLGCDLAQDVKKTRRIFFCDFDNTLMVKNTSQEIVTRRSVWQWMLQSGGLVGISARMPEMMMDKDHLEASRAFGFLRPEPHWSLDESGLYVSGDLTSDPRAEGCLNAPAIASFGSYLLLRHGDHYLIDAEHAEGVKHWRQQMLARIAKSDAASQLLGAFAPIDDPANYLAGKADVYPPECRITLLFGTLAEKNDAKEFLFKLEGSGNFFRIVDESKQAVDRYVIYLVPREATKERMLDRIVSKMVEEVQVPSRNLSVVIIGDHITDLRAGLFGGMDAQCTFILIKGSPLAPYISPRGTRRGEPFAGEATDWIVDSNWLQDSNIPGKYRLVLPERFMRPPRDILILDEVFEDASVDAGPGSLAAYAKVA